VVFNAAFINSDVRTGFGDGSLNRGLQGQSPYLVNAGLFYQDERKGWQANLLYNVIGPRIFVIGDNEISANIYEMPRHVVDLNLTKTLTDRLELKLNIQDLFNQPFRLAQDTDRDNEITDQDGTFQRFQRGTYSSLGLTWRF
jgi:outer membrane receptor protein involved in Fe transport